MDPRTGDLYPDLASARAAGVSNPVEIRGRLEDVERVAAAVERDATRRAIDTSHECPAAGCEIRVPRNLLACRRHWARVSPATQREVYAAYRRRHVDLDRHAAAVATAIDEINR